MEDFIELTDRDRFNSIKKVRINRIESGEDNKNKYYISFRPITQQELKLK